MVTDATMLVIFCVIFVSSLCAIKLAIHNSSSDARRKFNKHVVPAFPCEGTLLLLARDGVMYVVPTGKSVVKTDMVREVHCGKIARMCDHQGQFSYFENDVDHAQQHGEYAVDQLRTDWSIGSVLSQDMTVTASDDELPPASPLQSPLAGEALTPQVQLS